VLPNNIVAAARRSKLALCGHMSFSSQTSVLRVTDFCPPVGDNGDRPVASQRCARHQDGPQSCL